MRGFCYNMVMNNGGQRSYTEWSQLVAKLAINVVDYLRPANEAEAKTEFLANQRLVRPRFTYNEINNADAKILRSSIAELLKELREDKTLMAEQRDYFTVELGQCWYRRREVLTPQRVVRCAKRRQKDLDGRMRRFMAVSMRTLSGLC